MSARRHDQNREGCERGVAPQRAEGVAEILRETVERRQPARFPVQLLRPGDPAETDHCLAPRLVRRQSAPQVFLHRHADVCVQLGRQVVVELALAEEREEARRRLAKGAGHCASTFPITAASRCQ